MEKFHAMKKIRLISAAFALILMAGLTFASPIVMAADDTKDNSEGNISDSDCAKLSESLAGALGCETIDQVSDFTEYSGSLEAPSESGYDSALTQTTNARDFIKTIVNYALSFLGLIATVVIIYGGIMYVMSRGDEDMTSKGKKSITYAVLGIVIIIGSFALVNTLIGAGGGGADIGSGSGAEGTYITETGAAFDVDAVLKEIEDITSAYLKAYDVYTTVNDQVDYLKSVEMPMIVHVTQKDYSAAGLAEALMEWITNTDSDIADQYDMINKSDVTSYVDDLYVGIQRIESAADPFSDTYEKTQNLYNYLLSGEYSSTSSSSGKNDCARMDENTYIKYFSTLHLTVTKADVDPMDTEICGYLYDIETAAGDDLEEELSGLVTRFGYMKALFDLEGLASYDTGSQLSEVVTAFEAAEDAITPKATTTQGTANQNIRAVATAMNNLYVLVESLDFVRVRLTASVTKGNAPLIVRFNALGTEDPSGLTVGDDQIQWDIDGDGNFEIANRFTNPESGVEIEGAVGSAVSAIFTKPGTYRVRLRVLSQDPNVAAGVSSVTVQVGPSKSNIYLMASAGGEPTLLADYNTMDKNGKYKVPVDLSSYKVTMAEALLGVTFDASLTTDGNGNPGPSGIVYYEWDFGDNDTTAGVYEKANKVVHPYGKEGEFNVSLTVTDSTGVQDKKYFKLYVASPAARISYKPTSGTVGTAFEFDGSGSSTDVGSIVSYKWTATKSGTPVTLTSASSSTLKTTFTAPGLYTVTLSIADSSGKSDTAAVTVLVESTAPVASFTYDIPTQNQPNVVIFDGSDSYDPDEGDKLTYEWDFDGELNKDYKILSGSAKEPKVTVQFLSARNYEVVLTVYDQYDASLRKSDTARAIVEIGSVLDVDMEFQGSDARHLDANGEAQVEILAKSSTADAFEIDYGDGDSDYTETVSLGQSRLTHSYKAAGVFYVTLKALDKDSNSNSIIRRVYVGAGDAPIAVLSVGSDGQDIGFGETLKGNIKTKFSFDSRDSINVDGSTSNLEYSWNFGDGVTSSQANVTHVFEEKATYTVTLTVRDKTDKTKTDETTMKITIEGIDPTIRGITVVPQGTSLETPLKVNVTVDAWDEDGKITYVKAWYFDLNDTATELGTVIAQTASFSLTINTKGETGLSHEYGFAAEVTDNDNTTVSSFDEISESDMPTLEVVNGTNETPVAAFTVDKTSVYVGEEITFSSTSYDPDGSIVKYWWDIEGDGFYNNESSESNSLSYTYTQVHTEGVNVQLKVEDNSGATASSAKLTVFVDSLSAPPDAAFLTDVSGNSVNFRNNSTIDTENGASLAGIYWDFDLAVDSNGNGKIDDDLDSFEENPSYTYDALGTYQVKMTIVDSTGQSDSVTQEVKAIESTAPTAGFSYTVQERSVKFKDESTVDEANGATVRSYHWDFDLDTDSNGDTDPENDVDAETKNPTFEYADYGDYSVKITVEDSFGKSDTIVNTVKVPNPVQPVTALLTSTPQPNSNKQATLKNDGDNLTLYYGAEGGSGHFLYVIDKNIFFDSDGDGVRDNDHNLENSSSGAWKTPFFKSYGQVVVKLTVTDNETGDSDSESIQVVFEGVPLGVNLFNATPTEMLFLLLSGLLSAIAGVSMVFHYRPHRSSKP